MDWYWILALVMVGYGTGAWLTAFIGDYHGVYSDSETRNFTSGLWLVVVPVWAVGKLVERYLNPVTAAKRLREKRQRKAHALNTMAKDRVANCECFECIKLTLPKASPPPSYFPNGSYTASSTSSGPTP